jgi:manganese oxidase
MTGWRAARPVVRERESSVSLFKREDREALGAGSAALAVIALVFAFSSVLVAAHADNRKTGVPAGAAQVTLSEFSISPASISVPVGGTIVVTNSGTATHNFHVQGTSLHTADISPGDSATLDVKGLKKGQYRAFCAIPGHRELGMSATLNVGTASSSSASSMGNMDPTTMTPAQIRAMNAKMDAAMKSGIDKYVAQLKNGPNTKGVGNQLLAPKVLADGTKEFDLTAKIVDWEVSPGKTVKAWTYNGEVPGPWIKVNVGDKVKVVLTNDLPESTAIHFHGLEVPNAMDGVPFITQPEVLPGKSFTYRFVAKGPAMGMYHSHNDAQQQVPDGLAGVLQVGEMPLPPSTGPVAREVPMVLNDAGVIGLSLNGKSFPATAPVIAKVGEWVEISYYNEGLQIHPMHLHGLPQLVIAKDGFPVPQPYDVDTVTVAPGERWTVLVHATADLMGANNTPGIWAFHCHILTHSEGSSGMFGMVTTFIVEPG